jgi:small-conductance mechanosensitive channel
VPGTPLILAASLNDVLQRVSQLLAIDVASLVQRGVKIVAILALAWLAKRLLRVLTRRLEAVVDDGDPNTLTAAEQRARTLSHVLNSIGAVAIWLTAGLMVLNLFITIGPLLAGVGVAGLAISFGAQSLVKDLISGFFVLLENQFGVGDIVTINDASGVVERMTLRVVMLRDLSGVLHIMPNGSINVVSNRTRGFSRSVLDVGVAYHERIDHVLEVLRGICGELWADAEWRALQREEPKVLGVQELGDNAVTVRLVLTTEPGKQWDVGREMRRRIKNRLDAEGISIPFPQRTLHLGDAQGLLEALRARSGA